MKYIRKTVFSLLAMAVIFFSITPVSAAVTSSSTYPSTDGTSGRMVINSVSSVVSGSNWNVSISFTINMMNSYLYTGGAAYDRYVYAQINGTSGAWVQIKSRTESWAKGTSRTFTYSMSTPVNPDNNIAVIRILVVDGNGSLGDVATFDTGNDSVTLQAVQKANALSLNISDKTLYTGESVTITPTLTPANTYNKAVTYSVSDPSVASVSSGGIIRAVKAGSAVITVTTADGSNISQTVNITVKQYVTDISLSVGQITLYTAQTSQISAAALPSDASDHTLGYTSADDSIASVDSSGLITAKKAGSTLVTIAALDGSGVSKTVHIAVLQMAQSITIDNSITDIYLGFTYQMNVSILPEDTSDKSVSYVSSDPNMIEVSAAGVLTPKSRGSAVITISTNDGSNLSASMSLCVKQYVQSIALSENEMSLYLGESKTLKASVLPLDADDQTYSYISSDESVATVNSSGKVTALKAGSAVISCRSNDGSNVTASCLITVRQYIKEISLSESDITIPAGTTYQIDSVVLPEDATNKALSYSSANSSVAAVTDSGLISAAAAGSTTITVSSLDGSDRKATCKVTVIQPIESIRLNGNSYQLYVGDIVKLSYEINPSDCTNQDVMFISSDDRIADISRYGKVTAKAYGSCVIRIISEENSQIYAECEITVTEKDVINVDTKTDQLRTDDPVKSMAEALPIDTSEVDSSDQSDISNEADTNDDTIASVNTGGYHWYEYLMIASGLISLIILLICFFLFIKKKKEKKNEESK